MSVVVRSVAVSIGFWTCLLLAAGCFAAVALSPKYLQHLRLRHELEVSQQRLVALEQKTLQLRDVVAALERDPAFAEELARVEFDAIRPGEEVFAVDAELRLNPRASAVDDDPEPAADQPFWMPIATVLAQAQDVRTALLLAAATLTIVGFTWLHEPAAARRRGPARTPNVPLGERLKARYRTAARQR